MSIAGIRSNRGDGYQTLVAFDWALTVLSDENYQWLEIDSITYLVDDVVVGKSDGSLIACQCKKNEIDFEAWTITSLSDELHKAARLLKQNNNTEVRFYSRNNFGTLGKLREHCANYQDASSYQGDLGQVNRKTDTALAELLSTVTPELSTYDFLRRTKFVTSDELDRMVNLLRERLRSIATNPDAGFNALWVRLDNLGARMESSSSSAASQHRLTKKDLEAILHEAGALLVPPMDVGEIRLSFTNTSSIGRSWRRDIAGERLANPVLNDLLTAINDKKRAILLTGLPGSGKTCAMLDLQEALELRAQSRPDIVPLFIQSREFADFATSHDRQAQGLSPQWVNQAARMAESAHVVVVIDSLDVLSIARDHSVLTYFLAQIDRLLLIPTLTVVTACRDFDKHYDRRIAERTWDCELKCQPLGWDNEVVPLLRKLGIATESIDTVTRELIQNPRELALFVELAQREGSFNVVTSQALAQRYLDIIVRNNTALGDSAIQAIEAIAEEMLRSRSLAVPHQRLKSSDEIKRVLCSLNVLQETQDGKLTFGHQTLLDVLVISGALRNGMTLNQFIQKLPPVPFVRPSIRSFVAQLALGERREFRKQLRAVMTGNAAFHIRRLVAESFSEQIPMDDDWPLMRDLREKQRDVFQIIYASAKATAWHHFWLRHLVPLLHATRDAEGLTGHAYRITHWKNDDTAGVLSYWQEILSLNWLDTTGLAEQLGFHINGIAPENLSLALPLLERLLELPQPDHSFLGRSIARCISAGIAADSLLWRYITARVSDQDLLEYKLDHKLRCQPHEFGDRDENFIRHRMEQSSALLDLALSSIELWSDAQASRYGGTRIGYRYGFLGETSYDKLHSQQDIRPFDSLNAVLNAVQSAIIHHAGNNSEWWKNNRERLCFNHEGALLYFAILACTASPERNIDLIGRILCDKNILELQLKYELGSLINSAFSLLSPKVQDAAIANILNIWNDDGYEESDQPWIAKERAELIYAIPCHLRSPKSQKIVENQINNMGILVREPEILSRGGVVCPPFSFDVFLSTSDDGVINLLNHYRDQSDWHGRGADFLVGGASEVGWQLREAASRHPSRFIGLLLFRWGEISNRFCDDIMDGIATYLSYRYGNLQTPGTWMAAEEPNPFHLAGQILDELERHPLHWQLRRSAASALNACSNIQPDRTIAERITTLAIGFEQLHEDNPIKGDKVGLIAQGINMVKGYIIETLMILAKNIQEQGNEFPELLEPTLLRFANDEDPAIRALILRRLPYFQSKNFQVGWKLFDYAMQDANGLWKIAEPCLYYAYHNHFEFIKPLLARLYREGCGDDLETWGRISALASMTGHIDFSIFIKDLKSLDKTEAWLGAARVWTHTENIRQHREECLSCLIFGLNSGKPHALAIAEQIGHIFDKNAAEVPLPLELLIRFFSILGSDCESENKHHRLFGFHEWLNKIAQSGPDQAVAVAKIYFSYVKRSRPYLYDHKNSLTQLMTRLFAEAEEREESDEGAMLQDVVNLQDTLLSLGVNGVVDWLKAAERP